MLDILNTFYFHRFDIEGSSILKTGRRYTLQITATDGVGNTALPWMWTWNTGKSM